MKNSVTIKVDAQQKNISLVGDLVAVIAMEATPRADQLSDIKTAVKEAVANAVSWAGVDFINVVILLDDANLLYIRVEDEGRGIEDLDKAMQPFYTKGGEEHSGMGFTIMQTFMDTCKVRSTDKGTVVELTKQL